LLKLKRASAPILVKIAFRRPVFHPNRLDGLCGTSRQQAGRDTG
jgi:hypothetical protein